MNAQSVSNASLNLLQLVLKINFNAAVMVLLISSLLSLSGSELLFGNTSELYGPLVNNLRFVLLYLVFVQLGVYWFYQISHSYTAIVILGSFLLALVMMLDFYCSMNQIEIGKRYQPLFLYVGLSHILYGGLYVLRKRGC